MESNNAYYPTSLSMEYPSEDGNSVVLMDLLGSADTNIQNIENIDLLKKNILVLNPIEKIIVEQRFFRGKSQKEVSLLIQKSQMTVSRMEKIVMKKLTEAFFNNTVFFLQIFSFAAMVSVGVYSWWIPQKTVSIKAGEKLCQNYPKSKPFAER